MLFQFDGPVCVVEELLPAFVSLVAEMDVDEPLEKLNKKDELKADLVKLRFYAGLTIEQRAWAW